VFAKALRLLREGILIGIVTFLLLEGLLRLYHYINPIFIFPDNSDNRFRSKPFAPDFEFTLNSGGFKDTEFPKEKVPGTVRLVGIGDSFVFGVVPYQYNFLTVLEEDLNAQGGQRIDVFNMGISRTSPREYLSVLIKEALPLKPDVALICIFIGNDFIEISPKPVLHRSFVIAAAKYVHDLLRYVEGNNVYGGRTSYYDDDTPTFSEEKFLEVEAGRTDIYIESHKMLPERLPRVMAYIDEIKAVCERNGIQLLIMLIPDEVQVDFELQQRVMESIGTAKERFDFALPNKRLGEELRSRNIAYLDLLEPFRLRSKDARLYKPRDTHWNIVGNRLAADLLHNFVRDAIDERQRS